MQRSFFLQKGARVPHRKNTASCATKVMPVPEQVTILLSQHVGAPCESMVRKGDHVNVGQLIGKSDQFVSALIHSSVSGIVKDVQTVTSSAGIPIGAVIVDADGKQTVDESVRPPKVTNREEFLAAVRASGLIGLGGAGFPAHVKLAPPPDKPVDTLLINAAECEPYITADYRECMEDGDDVAEGIRLLVRYLGFSRVIVGIEDNKPDAIALLKEKLAPLSSDSCSVSVQTLRSVYPQGAEKVLVYQLTGRIIGEGKLPMDVGVVMMNVSSTAFLAKYLRTGLPLISRRVTVDGSCVGEPGNVQVLVGTPISKVLEFCGGLKEECAKLLMGGPMMGVAVFDQEMPILKQNNAILAFNEKEGRLPEIAPCIRCGRCARACPMNLMPPVISRLSEAGDREGLVKNGVNVCIECGCCAFVCPAFRPLVQTMRMAKLKAKE